MGTLPMSTKLEMGLPPCYFPHGGKTTTVVQPPGHFLFTTTFAFQVLQGVIMVITSSGDTPIGEDFALKIT